MGTGYKNKNLRNSSHGDQLIILFFTDQRFFFNKQPSIYINKDVKISKISVLYQKNPMLSINNTIFIKSKRGPK